MSRGLYGDTEQVMEEWHRTLAHSSTAHAAYRTAQAAMLGSATPYFVANVLAKENAKLMAELKRVLETQVAPILVMKGARDE